MNRRYDALEQLRLEQTDYIRQYNLIRRHGALGH